MKLTGETVQIDAGFLQHRYIELLTSRIMLAVLIPTCTILLFKCPLVITKEVKQIVRVPEVRFKEKIVTKEVPAAYPECDPDLVIKAKFYITEINSWNTLATSNHWLSDANLNEVKADNSMLETVPIKERLEAHRQLGF